MSVSIASGVSSTNGAEGSPGSTIPFIASQRSGAPYLMAVTGTTSLQYYEIADIPNLNLNINDNIEIEALYSYTASTNNKIIGVYFGPNTSSTTLISQSTRAVASEGEFTIKLKLWAETNSSLVGNTSLIAPFGPANASPNSFSIDLSASPMKLYLSAQLALSTETILLRAYQVTVNRSGL